MMDLDVLRELLEESSASSPCKEQILDRIQSLVEEAAVTRANDALRQREAYLQAIVSMQRALLTTEHITLGALNHALAPLGEATDVSRVYLFENHRDERGDLFMSQRAEWCAPGIQPELHNPDLQNLSYKDFFPRWADRLEEGLPIQGLVRDFPLEEREILEPQNILSILVLPLMVEQAVVGFIGFDDCVHARQWHGLEIDFLSSAANNIGIVLEQRKTERALRDLNHELEHARDEAWRANRAKSVFLAKVSHELRTPLNAVIGYSELLLEEFDMVEEEDDVQTHGFSSLHGMTSSWRRDLERVLGSGRHLLLMVDDLLDLSRIEVDGVKLRVEPHDLQVLIQDVVTLVEHSLETRGNAFFVEIDSDVGVVATDKKALMQLLINILSNAFKYTREGRVDLRVRRAPPSLDTQEELMEVVVADSGEGMSEKDLQRVFDAFVQADDSYTRAHEGVGLGLAIASKLAEALHVQIEVQSVRHEGTTFSLTFPRTHPALREG